MAVLLELFHRPGELDLELRDDVLLAAPARLTGSGCLGLGSGHVLGPAGVDRDGADERGQADAGGVEHAGEAAYNDVGSHGRQNSRPGSASCRDRARRRVSHCR